MKRSVRFSVVLGTFFIVATASPEVLFGQDEGATRYQASLRFHYNAVQKPGVLLPLYVYPKDVHKNESYNRVMELRRKYSQVPFWVVLNPASGPGNAVDANYTKAIDRLIGAGCQVLGYVPTGYGKTPRATVAKQLQVWRKMYPRVHGIFFDEMIYEDTEAGVEHQKQLNATAHAMGYWPTVGNPGTDTPGSYFAADTADVIVIHESGSWPSKSKLQGDYFGGHSDYPSWKRAVLIHSEPNCNSDAIAMVARYARWVYVTDDTYKVDDPVHNNPWDQLSTHLETLCESLAR